MCLQVGRGGRGIFVDHERVFMSNLCGLPLLVAQPPHRTDGRGDPRVVRLESFGRIDILHNNAGVVLVKFLEDTSEEEWDRVAEVNLKFIFPAVQYAVASMRSLL